MIIFSVVIGTTFAVSNPDGPEDVIWIFYFMPIFLLISAATQFLWMWNVAVNLRHYIHSADRKPRVNLFRLTFFLPLVLICCVPVFMANFIGNLSIGTIPDAGDFISFILLMMLSNFVLMFCLLNNNYVVAKTLKMAELQRKVVFGDFVGDFFFLLIFPVAIWFLQPRINAVVNKEMKELGFKDAEVLD